MHRALGDRLFESHLWIPTRKSAATAAAIGVFTGFLPLIGLQTFLAILLSYFLRANITIAALSTFFSNFFTVGTILLLQIKLGEWLIPGQTVKAPPHMGMSQYFALYGKALLIGSSVTAVVGAILAYPVALWLWKIGERAAQKRRQKP